MARAKKTIDREELLANIAELYYQEGKTQAQISKNIGITRSAISRMLTEARQKGIVEIHIHRPLRYNPELEETLIERFHLRSAHVISIQDDIRYDEIKKRLGRAAASILQDLLKSNQTLGIAWGTTIQATIDAFEERELQEFQVVQLLGVLGSNRHAYSGQALVERMARKVNGEGLYLYAPFIVENEDTARLLREDQSIRQTIEAGRRADIALLGVGSTKPGYCSLYQGGHISREDLNHLRKAQAVGDVSGQYFDIDGNYANVSFHKRVMGISHEDLLNIPIRMCVAGNEEKAEAILGAMRGGFNNILVTDDLTAARIIEIS